MFVSSWRTYNNIEHCTTLQSQCGIPGRLSPAIQTRLATFENLVNFADLVHVGSRRRLAVVPQRALTRG